VISTSDSRVVLCQLESSGIRKISEWIAHEFEAWIAAFDYHHPNIVFSGADDCLFKGWDIREISSNGKPLFSKRFDVGVTSIQSSPHREHCLAIGSYDDTISIWDTRMIEKPICLIRHNVGGGVWRVKWHPSDPNLLVTACMRKGFKVFNYEQKDTQTKLIPLDSFRSECESLAYGVDWCYSPSKYSNMIATCSFYDRICSLWNPKLQNI